MSSDENDEDEERTVPGDVSEDIEEFSDEYDEIPGRTAPKSRPSSSGSKKAQGKRKADSVSARPKPLPRLAKKVRVFLCTGSRKLVIQRLCWFCTD